MNHIVGYLACVSAVENCFLLGQTVIQFIIQGLMYEISKIFLCLKPKCENYSYETTINN